MRTLDTTIVFQPRESDFRGNGVIQQVLVSVIRKRRSLLSLPVRSCSIRTCSLWPASTSNFSPTAMAEQRPTKQHIGINLRLHHDDSACGQQA